MTPVLEGIAPIVPVREVRRASAWFQETFGFELRNHSDSFDWALLARGEAGLMLVTAPPHADLDDEARQCSAYIWVKGVDALWEECRDKLAGHPSERVRAPFEQPYGMREFHVSWDSFLLIFGESLEDASA